MQHFENKIKQQRTQRAANEKIKFEAETQTRDLVEKHLERISAFSLKLGIIQNGLNLSEIRFVNR